MLSAADTTTLQVFSVLVIAGGWIGIFALWWFVFRGRGDDEDGPRG